MAVVAHGQQKPLAVIVKASYHSTWRLNEESAVDVPWAVTVTFRGLCDGHKSTHSHALRRIAFDAGSGLLSCSRSHVIAMFKDSFVAVVFNKIFSGIDTSYGTTACF